MQNLEEEFRLNSENSQKIISKIRSVVKQLIVSAIGLFFLGLYFVYFGMVNFSLNKLKLNELGDFYAGSVGIIWGLAGVLLILISFLTQKEQNHQQALELKMSKYMFDKQIEQANLKNRMEIHSKFQAEMRNIQRQLKFSVNTEVWNPGEEEIRTLQIYWYFVFDEWFTCKNGGEIISSLWTEHYRHGAKSALRNKHFSDVLDEILSRKTSFLGQAKEFEVELEQLKREIKNEK